MVIFHRTTDEGEFLTSGKSIKEIAGKMGISPYLFKKQGWEKVTDPEQRKLLMGFITVSKALPRPEGSEQLIYAGPFTKDELLTRVERDRNAWRRSYRERRKEKFRAVVKPSEGRFTDECDFTMNIDIGSNFINQIALMDDEIPIIIKALEEYLEGKNES